MAKVLLLFLFALAIPILTAEETMPQGFEHWTADSLKQLDQTLHSEADTNANHMSVRRLGDFANDTFMLSRRQADGIAEWHETQVDVFSSNQVRQHCWSAVPWQAPSWLNRTRNERHHPGWRPAKAICW